ncbi:MAG: hypothetical protein UT36_C0013G0023 [Candidatus Peregrinibacteria bacterium GW2011_GWF2_39_17]|nr:MAG: hypothetical protein UT36_C0013G0023 [Candidatus Peregrinibacteria bacterium GW2011_GWF2_39_17]HCW32450.1 hypothetical protein [Candidatus Peregrinibacteria bacterium]
MIVQAIHVGKRINIRGLLADLKFNFKLRDPLVIEYPKKGRFVVILKYGVVVFWGFSLDEIQSFLLQISNSILEPLAHPSRDEVSVLLKCKRDKITLNMIKLGPLSIERVAVLSIILARSVVLDYFEKEVEKILDEFDSVIQSFSQKGRTSFSSRMLLQKVGAAMKIQHLTVSQMAMLDKPDLTWDDPALDRFYHLLEEEYEIEDRYSVLSQKIKGLFHNVEFILNFLDARRSVVLEIIIILLIFIEIVLFVGELLFLR